LHLSKNCCLMVEVLWPILSFRSTRRTSWNRYPWYWTRDKRRHTEKSWISLRKHLVKMLRLHLLILTNLIGTIRIIWIRTRKAWYSRHSWRYQLVECSRHLSNKSPISLIILLH
jgi:hypothetical protein